MRPRIGDRVRITGLMNDPDPLPIGLEGTVVDVTPSAWTIQQYDVKWDGGRRNLLLLPGDPFTIL